MAELLVQTTSELANALEAWWRDESADWDQAVNSGPEPTPDVDLWDNMPVVDSKAVARMSPVFEKYLGVPLDVKLIRRGGYTSIQDLITDLVPKMEQLAQSQVPPTVEDDAHE